MRKTCFSMGDVVSIIGVVTFIVALLRPEYVLPVVGVVVALTVAKHVYSWLECRIKVSIYQKWYKRVFIYIGEAIICIIVASVASFVVVAFITGLALAIFLYFVHDTIFFLLLGLMS